MKFFSRLFIVLFFILGGCSNSKIKLPDDLTQKIGSENFGYILVPKDFYEFSDISYPDSTDIQYSDASATNIVTMNIVELNGREITLEKMASNIKNYLSQNIDFVSADGKMNQIGDYNVYQLDCKYKNGINMTVNLFEDNSGVVHYISVEGSEDFVSKYNNPIVYSFKN